MQNQTPDFTKLIFTALWEAAKTFLTHPLGRVLLGIVALVYLLKFVDCWLERRRLAASGMDEVDRFSGRDFEKFLEIVFQRLGYSVERTQYVGDFGADLVLVKDGVRTVVQAKRYNKKVGIKAVQEVVAAKGTYKCSEAMVVTNSTYTSAAVKLARDNGVRLWDREDLIKARLEMRTEAPVVASTSAPLSRAASGPICAQTVHLDALSATCGTPVGEKVWHYYEGDTERFEGQVFCFECQRRVRRGVSGASETLISTRMCTRPWPRAVTRNKHSQDKGRVDGLQENANVGTGSSARKECHFLTL